MWKPKKGCLKICFETAWSTPFPVMEKLQQKYDIESLECSYADEDIGSNCGIYGWYDGGFYEKELLNPESFARSVWARSRSRNN